MMPYGTVILGACIVLAVRHVLSRYSSRSSKYVVGVVTAVTLLAAYAWPPFLPFRNTILSASLWLWLAICLYAILHQIVFSPEA
jgi:hypothetical protein